ncbi:MAG: AmmeMemoRadiSam system protein B [Candidatus Marinimicrobia bacterium]|nr:AmmeMemoRadiSam system protein B [Candidatus Neomarinimicrobiota bacterium]
MKKKIRKPVAAGRFYSGSPQALQQEINAYLQEVPESELIPKRIFGLISPHAGYACSAPTAAYGFQLLRQYPFKRAIVISPSHSDYFTGISVYDGDAYETPLGIVPVDQQLCTDITEKCAIARLSEIGHRSEHALEVQLPFLQIIYPDGIDLVPVTVGATLAGDLSEFAAVLAETVNPDDTVIIASSDLSHYYSQSLAHQKDGYFTRLLEDYDLEALGSGYDDQSLEACGLGPILVLMHVAKMLGNAQCRVLDYRTSGDTCGDKMQVVGYASAVVYE